MSALPGFLPKLQSQNEPPRAKIFKKTSGGRWPNSKLVVSKKLPMNLTEHLRWNYQNEWETLQSLHRVRTSLNWVLLKLQSQKSRLLKQKSFGDNTQDYATD